MPRKYVQGKGYGVILLLSSLCFIFPKFSFDTWTLKSKFSGHRFWLSTQRLTLTKGKKIQLFSFVLTNCKMHHSFWRIVPNDRQKEIHFKRNFFHLILKNHQIWQKFLKTRWAPFIKNHWVESKTQTKIICISVYKRQNVCPILISSLSF